MSEVIVDLDTGRLFMSAEEELMETLGWGSIVNLWRIQEAISKLESDWIDALEVIEEMEEKKNGIET